MAGDETHGLSPEALGLCLRRLFLVEGGVVITADPSAENIGWLKAYTGCQRIQPVSRETLLDRIKARHGDALLDEAVHGLARRFPELSAQTVMTRGQGVVLCLLGAGLVAALVRAPGTTFHVMVAVLSLAFAASGIFRAFLAMLGAGRPGVAPPASHCALPTYTVIVPLYREAAVVPELVRALKALDYPPDLLDLKLVVEADDAETIAAAEQAQGTSGYEIIRVPPGGPRTKPKAANYALAFARGEYLVIYDAEDRPDPDQLLKAVARFRASPRTTACLQARLTIHNAGQNWLTRGIMAQTPQENLRVPAYV